MAIGTGCTSLIAGIAAFCDASTLTCEGLDILDIFEADVAVYPEVRTNSGFRRAAKKPVSDDDSPPNFDIAFSGTVSIETLTTVPKDPDPNEAYIASTQIYCPSPGTEVTISVVGTDDYMDSRTVTLDESSVIRLDVPGAEENVRDDITVEVKDGPMLSTQIVF